MKKYFFILILFIYSMPATARHVAGGELFYEYVGPAGAGVSTYKITLRLFRDFYGANGAPNTGPLLQNETVVVGFYSNTDLRLVTTLPLPISSGVSSLSLNVNAIPCLSGDPKVNYETAIYSATINLPDNAEGYTLSRLGCCRINEITNLSIKTNVGSNYMTKIPGTLALPQGHNSSPQFLVKDTALVCANRKFKLDFGAIDKDGDQLTYTFCTAYSAPNGGNNIQPPSLINMTPVSYQAPYSGSQPLGASVDINANTGIISGIAPGEGQYVVSVCITEWRNGKPITEHRKDFILKVQFCDFIEADLPDRIVQCKDSIVHFENGSASSAITSYLWTFGDNTSNISSAPTVDYPYADTGRYMARLTVTGPNGCVGTDSVLVLVYPGFQPDFTVVGSCYFNPYQFNDLTTAKYGFVNSWYWNFGDNATAADTSLLQNPTYKYPGPATNDIGLVVTSSKGCIDSVHKDFIVRDKPQLQLPFRDTLICSIDTLAIPVLNSGQFSWSPNTNILFPNTSKPLVFPKDTIKYYVTLSDNGCTNTDSVTINVLDFITVDLGPDSIICKTDPVRLHPVSYGLQYQWASSSGEIVSNIKFPLVKPLVNTKYYVTVNLGKCQSVDTITLRPIPYPVAVAGPDTVICIGTRIRLMGSMIASSMSWSPGNSLSATNTLTPIAGPSKTTTYILQVTDTLGCPKPVTDTVVVTVIPPITANAGRDTIAVVGQPVQLEASGSEQYNWTPETWLNNSSIYNPIATIGAGVDSVVYKVRVSDSHGCYGDDFMVIRIMKTGPEIFVPSAFTPNSDGKNDVLKPVTVGITTLHFFKVFNRWGQLLFSTTTIGKGWDGWYNGQAQPAGAYVYEAEGWDYKGTKMLRKGTVVLIR
ncbi:MAG: PKD domain-containing protein [Bacteroidota bacterium]